MRIGITANGNNSTTGMMSEVGREQFSAISDDGVRDLKAYLEAR